MAQLDRIFIRNLIVLAKIGIFAQEQKTPQRIRVNCELFVSAQNLAKQSGIDQTVCYATIREKIIGYLESDHTPLLEAAANDIAQLCLADVRIQRIEISLEKLDIFPDCESAGVSIVREQMAGS